jgi:hypothetical protein
MLLVPHAAAGAALGKWFRSPWIAVPLALAIHFVLDMLPHIDSHGLFGAPSCCS